MLDKYTLVVPHNVHCGEGKLFDVPEMLKQKGFKNIALIVTDNVAELEIFKAFYEQMEKVFSTTLVTDVPPEPEENQVRIIADRMLKCNAQAIVAIGGGSILDSAKFISVMMTNPDYYNDLTDKEKIVNKGLPLIAVPTSAGTGSEATPNAIILIPEKKLKVGVVHNYFLPDDVILDPVLTKSMPQKITASTGLDAFCHCIETYISKKTNPFARLFGLEGIKLISKYLRRAYDNGNDMEARTAMLLAAFYGGVAITASSTVAVHALSYPLGGTYRIPHGISNAILLPYVMKFNMDAIEEDIPTLCGAMNIDTNGKTVKQLEESLINEIFALCRYCGIPDSLVSFGIKADDIDSLTLAASEVHRLLDQNPKVMSLDDIKSVYIQLF